MTLEIAYTNELTELISNSNVDLEIVLLHRDLFETIRHGSDILYKRVFLNDHDKWIYQIFDYALFNKASPIKYKKYNLSNEINVNAAAFLRYCGLRFMKYFTEEPIDDSTIKPRDLQILLYKKITKFISKENDLKIHPMYAGNFVHIVKNFLYYQVLDQETISELTPYLVNNCRLLVYHQLISEILSKYVKYISQPIIYDLLTRMLQRSFVAVKFARDNNEDKLDSVFFTTKRINRKNQLKQINQPLNCNKKPIPLINMIFEVRDDVSDLNESNKSLNIPWKGGHSLNKIKYSSIEDAETDSYLLLLSIRQSISSYINLLNYFREYDEENNFPLIQALLYCGTRSRVKSLVSLEAFRILSIIFNGSVELDAKPWKITEEEKSKLDFYNSYADEMIFDPTCLTYKMIHALPIFWSHRYNKDEYKMSYEEKEKIDTSDYYGGNEKHFRQREKGETALEIVQPCLFCEPPISSQLIYFCNNMFIQLSLKRKKIMKKKPLTVANRDMMVKLDGIYLDFFRHSFDFGSEYPNVTLPSLAQSKLIFPLPPSDQKYFYDTHKHRPVLNGFINDFFIRLTSMELNSFFQDITGNINGMGRLECFTKFNLDSIFYFKMLINFENLKEDTIYNRSKHSDFSFKNSDDDDDDNDRYDDEDDKGSKDDDKDSVEKIIPKFDLNYGDQIKKREIKIELKDDYITKSSNLSHSKKLAAKLFVPKVSYEDSIPTTTKSPSRSPSSKSKRKSSPAIKEYRPIRKSVSP